MAGTTMRTQLPARDVAGLLSVPGAGGGRLGVSGAALLFKGH